MDGSCVRCGKPSPLSELDVVGNGYRCAACSLAAEIAERTEGIEDLDDNQDQATREAEARRTKRQTIAATAALGGLAPLAYVIGGGYVAAGVMMMTTMHLVAGVFESAHTWWRRGRGVRTLPRARLRR